MDFKWATFHSEGEDKSIAETITIHALHKILVVHHGPGKMEVRYISRMKLVNGILYLHTYQHMAVPANELIEKEEKVALAS